MLHDTFELKLSITRIPTGGVVSFEESHYRVFRTLSYQFKNQVVSVERPGSLEALTDTLDDANENLEGFVLLIPVDNASGLTWILLPDSVATCVTLVTHSDAELKDCVDQILNVQPKASPKKKPFPKKKAPPKKKRVNVIHSDDDDDCDDIDSDGELERLY